jgi:putative acetyltransferase
MSAASAITVRAESPDQADIRAMLAELDAYLADLYPPDHNHILDVKALLSPQVHFLVARRAGEAVGCGAVRFKPGEPDTAGQAYGEIKRMFVRPGLRGQGIAQALLQALEQHLRGAGVALATLETGDLQSEALRLYERSGYVKRTAFGGYDDNGTSVFYEKRLSAAP